MGATASESRVFIDQDMAEETILRFAGGQVAIYSARAPDSNGSNQDGAVVAVIDSERGVLAVADGMGGQPGGASAVGTALTQLERSLSAADDSSLSRSAILDGIERANRAVIDLGIGAATTLSVAEIASNTLRSYQVGDSTILVVGQRGKVKLKTLSQSPVGYAVESGMLDAEEALHHEERHLVSNIVGAQDMRIEVGSSLRLAPRDTVLLATDGLMDNLSLEEVVEAIRTGPLFTVARRLAATCGQRMRDPSEGEPSKPDDLTFILFRLSH
jgi:serine/threonine protein phosphatase PrpC